MNAGSNVIEQSHGDTSAPLSWAESGRIPDVLIRAGIRHLCRQRLKEIGTGDTQHAAQVLNQFVAEMNRSEIAPLPERANEQHYEVPPEFFGTVLGKHRKYSACHWSSDTCDLDSAEAEALRISCERAQIEDGMDVLDLGCGWGSLSLWIAQRYPACRITSVSNSRPQGRFIEAEAQRRGLTNVQVITADMNHFDTDQRFHRIVSVEMFEHMRNYATLFGRIASWMAPDARFFMHIFCHRSIPYAFVDRGAGDWMSRHFFSGGIMPSADLPLRFQQDLTLDAHWRWDGRHYEKTANAWLRKLDGRRDEVRALFEDVYGNDRADLWVQRWRIFFMACAELFGMHGGQEWSVGHYRFTRNDGQPS